MADEIKEIRSVYVSAHVWKTIKKMAGKDGRSISNYIDRVLIEHAEKAKP